ncbi:MAG: lytic transglycosylase F [bacterium]|nr:MAG: lytic transglycosylase F [bacterium]
MKKTLLIPVVLLILTVSCRNPFGFGEREKTGHKKVDLLDSILTRKKIIALTDYSPNTFFIYRGERLGYQYELLQAFAKYLGVSVDLRIESNLDSSFRFLQEGRADVLAMGLTVTGNRTKFLLFSEPLFYTRQVLVQRKPKNYREMATADEINAHLIRNLINLGGVTIHIRKGSVYYPQLLNLENNIGDTIYIIQDTLSTEMLIQEVAQHKIDYTVADQIIARNSAKIYPNIDVKTRVSFEQKIAWAVRKDQKQLVDTLNAWLRIFNKTLESRLLYNKYFKNMRVKRLVRSAYYSYTGGKLSPYDSLIKKAAKKIHWDWRLLASMIYQESQFKPNVTSWVGAYGLMQLMPATMQAYGITEDSGEEAQIDAGVRLLKSFESQLPATITDSVERIKFVLASYNSGLAHILDARRLAEKFGKNPNVWTGNVDYFVLHLSEKKYYHDPVVRNGYMRGWETYDFVKEIFDRYNGYKTLIDQ